MVAPAVGGLVICVLVVIVDLVAACLRVFWLVDFGFILAALFAFCGSGVLSGWRDVGCRFGVACLWWVWLLLLLGVCFVLIWFVGHCCGCAEYAVVGCLYLVVLC